jgi:quercetin dioxygenase-like cupin family protein
MYRINAKVALAAVVGLAGGVLATLTVGSFGLEPPAPIAVYSGGETVLGQPLAYPAGTPKLTASVVIVPPGTAGAWHVHPVPLFGYILQGEVTLDYGSKGTKVFKAGDALLEAQDWPHRPVNNGTEEVRILAVSLGADGAANSEPAAGPQ